MNMDNLDDQENLSWAAYHSSSNIDDEVKDRTTSLSYPCSVKMQSQ